MGLPILAQSTPQSETVVARPVVWPRVAAVLTAIGVVILPVFAQSLLKASQAVTVERETTALDVTLVDDQLKHPTSP